MKRTFYFILVILLFQSCELFFRCPDEALTIERVDNNTYKLKLNGYYYGAIRGDNAQVYLLYQNGIFYKGDYRPFKDVEKGDVDFFPRDTSVLYEHRTNWGVYLIENNDIEIEYWVTRLCGGAVVAREQGTIINDTTFVITYRSGSKENPDAVFMFHEFNQKPDSTIKFIP